MLVAAILCSQLAPNGLGGYSPTLPVTKGMLHTFSTGDKVAVEAIVNLQMKPPTGTDGKGKPLSEARIAALVKTALGSTKPKVTLDRIVKLTFNNQRVGISPILENYFVVRKDPIFVCKANEQTKHIKFEVALVNKKLTKVDSFSADSTNTTAGWKVEVEKVIERENPVHKGIVNQGFSVRLQIPVADYGAGLSLKTQEPDDFLKSVESCFLTPGRVRRVAEKLALVEYYVIRSAKAGVAPEFTLYSVSDERTALWIPVGKK